MIMKVVLLLYPDAMTPPTLLLVHGAWHGGWCWEKLQAALDTEATEARTVDLPSAGGRSGIAADVNAIRQVLARIEGHVVVVAHSYGGIPVTQAIVEAPNVVHVVYLAAFQLDVGESLLGFYGAPLPPDGEEEQAVPDDPISVFYADVPASEAEQAVERLLPQSTRSFSDVVEQAGWHLIPSTYIVCERDQALSVEHQEALAGRATEAHPMASSHSPFLSAPEELAALLSKIARNTLA
ncbi:alpha/beta fold hydrolase [Streptomyces sp. SS1-1]|uniref:alpha/beta fold hydrolase n=1 Tax=Streptomyces sp. SS1-1 TaxID=2651869 RepID=UPI00178C27C4|nr:alpha/beta fold hydrolase [Streptomyces sp. SS1-1]